MSANIERMEAIQLTKDKKKAVMEQKRKLLARNILAAGIILLIIVLVVYSAVFKYPNFSDRIMFAGFALVFVLIEIKMMQEIGKIMEFSTDRIKGIRCIVCEKKSVKSKDLINRSRNTFAAGKAEDGTMIYANCTVKRYEQIIVNETTGLFYVFDGDDKIRIVVE